MSVRESDLDHLSANAIYASLLVDMLGQSNVSQGALLAGTGIQPEQLSSLDSRLSARQYNRLIDNARVLSKDPALAFKFGTQLKLSTHGFLGFAAMSAASLGEAIALAVKYCRTRFDFIELTLHQSDQQTTLQVSQAAPLGSTSLFFIDSIMTSLAVGCLNMLGEIPSGIQVKRVCEKPAYFEQMKPWLPQRPAILFNQSADQVIFTEQLLQRPLNLSDPLAKQLAEQQCQRELDTIPLEDELLYQIQRKLKQAEPGYLKLDQMAESLHMSSRTLKRRLQQRGTSFQDLLDLVRMGQAKRLLFETSQSIDAIASTLGYSDASNFSRAFKRKEGVTPAVYRRQKQ